MRRIILAFALLAMLAVAAVPALAQVDQEFEQDADSGDVDQSFDISSEGDNSNQCVGITGNANTGNAQTQFGATDFGNVNGFDRFDRDRRFGDFDFDDSEATLDVGGFSSTSCDQEVNQAAAAG